MKVVDMFGCGLPVAAIGFPAIGKFTHEQLFIWFSVYKSFLITFKELFPYTRPLGMDNSNENHFKNDFLNHIC